jgi:hypothetical protein
MAQTADYKRATVYVRVPRVGSRVTTGGQVLICARVRENVQPGARSLVDVVEELDGSCGDNARPLWNACIEGLERGEGQGRLGRLEREPVRPWRFSTPTKALDRIGGAGGRLYLEEGAEGLS